MPNGSPLDSSAVGLTGTNGIRGLGESALGSAGTHVVGGLVRPPGPPTPEGQPGDAGCGTATTAAPANLVRTGRISDLVAASIRTAVDVAAEACRDTPGPLLGIIGQIGANLRRLERSAPRTIGGRVSGADRRPVGALIGMLERHGYGAFADIVVAHWDGTLAAPRVEPTAEPPSPRMAFVPLGPTAEPPSVELRVAPMTSTRVGPTDPVRAPTPAEMDELDSFFADVNGTDGATSVDGDAGRAGGKIRRTTPTDKSDSRAGPYGRNEDAGCPLPGQSDVAPGASSRVELEWTSGVGPVGAPRPRWNSGVYELEMLAGSLSHPGLHAYRYVVVESTVGKKTMTVWTWAPGAGADVAKKSGAAAGARPPPDWATDFFEVAGWPSANCGGLVRGPATVPVCVQRKEILNPLGSSYFQDPVPVGKPNSDWRVIRSDYRCVYPGPTDE